MTTFQKTVLTDQYIELNTGVVKQNLPIGKLATIKRPAAEAAGLERWMTDEPISS